MGPRALRTDGPRARGLDADRARHATGCAFAPPAVPRAAVRAVQQTVDGWRAEWMASAELRLCMRRRIHMRTGSRALPVAASACSPEVLAAPTVAANFVANDPHSLRSSQAAVLAVTSNAEQTQLKF